MTVSSQGGEPRFKLSGVSVCLCVQQARHWKITVSYSEPHLPRCSCVFAVLALFLLLRSASLSMCVLASAKQLDPVGSTVRYEMMKLCTGSV